MLVAVVPCYNERETAVEVCRAVAGAVDALVVVDDGSRNATPDALRAAGLTVVQHEVNRGKGAALVTGVAWARANGAAQVVTLDADGQHDPADIDRLVACAEETGADLVLGSRQWDADETPWLRRRANQFSSRLISRWIGQPIPDTQCGLRWYGPRALARLPWSTLAGRFETETAILLCAAGQGLALASVPIAAVYTPEAQAASAWRPVRDSWRIARVLWRYRKGNGPQG